MFRIEAARKEIMIIGLIRRGKEKVSGLVGMEAQKKQRKDDVAGETKKKDGKL